MKIKPTTLTLTLYYAVLVAIFGSSWAAYRWRDDINWVIAGFGAFMFLLCVVAFIGARKAS